MLTCALTVSLLLAGRVEADEILFLNGDRLTGKIKSADGGSSSSRPIPSARSPWTWPR
jgi:hypothetical protein